MESERYRYENAKRLYDALDKKDAASPTDQQLAESFQASFNIIIKDTATALERVAELTPKDEDYIRDVVSLAVKTWLEIQKERYRVRLLLPEGSKDVMTSRESNNRLCLVVRPLLKRWGNGQGQDLTNEALIMGWKGESVTYGSP